MATPTTSTLVVLPPRSGMPAVDQNGVFTPEWMNFFHQQASPKINYIGANFIGQITTSSSTQGITVAQQSGTNAYQVSIGLAQNLESISTTPNSSGALVNNGSGSYTYTPIPQGTITSISIATANGFGGTVATPTTIPVLTLSTTISGILKGSSGALVAAVAGTDYLQPISFTQGSVLYAGATGTFAQDNANLFYNPTGYASMPTVQFGPRGANPIDAGFEFYVSSGTTAHFHNVNTTQSFTGGVTVELCYSPAGAAVQTGNRVGSLEFAGSYNTSDNVGSCAAIRSYSQDNFTSTTLGGNLVFQTVPSGTSTLKTALTLGSDQSAAFTGILTGISFNSITGISSSNPLVDGTASHGSGTVVSLGNHVHPTDTTRAASNATLTLGSTILTLGNIVTTLAGLTSLSITGISTLTGDVEVNGGIRQYGTEMIRVEGTGSVPSGATGQGIELAQYGTSSVIQSYNRSTSAYTPLTIAGSTIALEPSGIAVLTANSSGVTITGNITGTLATAAQPNITSLGTLSSLTTTVYAVASLPAGVVGMRAMVNNALAPTFGATVVAGGLVTVPVYYDGTSWKVG